MSHYLNYFKNIGSEEYPYWQPSDLYKTIYDIEDLNDSHIETAMKKILKGYN